MSAQPSPIFLSDNAQVPLIAPYRAEQLLIDDDSGGITQERFLSDLLQLARQLPECRHVFNLCQDRYHFLLGFCAALLRGTINLLPPNQRESTLADIAASYPDNYCLIDTPCDLQRPQVDIRELLPTQRATVEAPPEIPARQIAAIAFTSGSTGTPSPHPKHWGTLAGTARLLARRFNAEAQVPAVLATVPPQHMYGLEMTTLMALQGERTLLRARPFFPADICRVIADHGRPITLVSTPTHLRSLAHSGLLLPPLADIVSATAPLERDLAQAISAGFKAHVREIYGCTEAGSTATRDTLQNSHWQLLDGFTLDVVDQGCTVRAPHLADEAPLQDQLQLHGSGQFSLLGRHSDMINIAGKRASLADLTLKLLSLEGVIDGVVFVPEGNRQHQRPVALVVSELPEKTISTRLASLLDPVFVPRPLRKVDALPRNETGKLTQAALQSLWAQTHDQ